MLVFLIATASCFFMTGVIWIVQLVHYPYFHYSDNQSFADAQKFHTTKISYVVLPAMIIELLASLYLLYQVPDIISPSTSFILFALLTLIWISTFFLQVPLHNSLAKEKNSPIIRRLVQTNWIRTLAWSLRSLIFLYSWGSFVL